MTGPKRSGHAKPKPNVQVYRDSTDGPHFQARELPATNVPHASYHAQGGSVSASWQFFQRLESSPFNSGFDSAEEMPLVGNFDDGLGWKQKSKSEPANIVRPMWHLRH
jgi:hypothetical protein